MAISSGSRLGPYEILSPLGAGGMGEVYRARDPRLQRDVAVKVLPPSFSNDPDRLRRFEQEAQAAGSLNHPNITAIYDIGTHDGAPYVVSELLRGETLRQRLAEGALPPRKAIDYALQFARGLAVAHEKGIVHRDLKPENLFITEDGRLKILDFGLAKLTRPEAGSGPTTQAPTLTAGTEPGVVMGTVGYMSPEQVRGRPAGHRSDIFSFGAVFYEMLTGTRAFRGDSPADTMSAILKEDPQLPASLPSASPAVERIVRRCLEKSPEERFHSAHDLAFALGEVSADAEASRLTPPPARARFRGIWWIPAAALALLAVILGWNVRGLRERLLRGTSAGSIDSLAVLPLENLSRDPEQEYFADGMTEALITDLSQIGALRVISRTSVMQYRGAKKPIREIARELGVDGVVEGSVLRAGDRVRITAQLIHAPTDRHLWAKSYERDVRDVLTLQSEVAQAIAHEIEVKLSLEEQTRLASTRSVNPKAHEAYLKGRYYWNKRTGEALLKSIQYFEQAIATDSQYAAAYAGLANCYVLLGGRGIGALPPSEVVPKAKAAALKALQIDESLAEAHAALAYTETTHDWDWVGSEKGFQRAIELNPNYATAHFWYGAHLAARGRIDEAIEEAKRAQELDPLSPIINAAVAWMYHFARRHDQAIEQSRYSLVLDPNFAMGHFRRGVAYEHKAMYQEAIAELQKAVASSGGSPDMIAALGHVYAVSGDRSEARKVIDKLKELSKHRYVSPYGLATIYVGLGEKDRAFEWLEKAYEERSWSMAFLGVEPDMDPLRPDPRFVDLLRRVGLTP